MAMLSQEENALVTQTGPGTPGGDLFRRYWQPLALAEELPRGGAPLPVRLLGEELVLFRDEQGLPGLLGLHCAHRGADLSYGRLEDGGLRCLYHGWLYDGAGRCLEQPGEPAGSTFKDRVRQPAYPCQEAGGLIFAYLGPGEPPLLPLYECLRVPDEHRWAHKIRHDCNYLQGHEGNVDPQHLSFLHHQFQYDEEKARLPTVSGTTTTSYALFSADVAPTIDFEETDFGLRMYSVRRTGPQSLYVRISNALIPNVGAFPAALTEGDGYTVHWHVPIDDAHHWKYILLFRRSRPLEKEAAARHYAADTTADYGKVRHLGNRYLQDREEMRTRSFTGMGPCFPTHDAWATESQGPIQDRTREHLGTTDRALIIARRLLLQAIRDVQEGRDPRTQQLDDLVVRAESVPSGTDWKTYWRQPAPTSLPAGRAR